MIFDIFIYEIFYLLKHKILESLSIKIITNSKTFMIRNYYKALD